MRVGPFQVQARAPAQPLTIGDWQVRASKRLPPMVLAYVENGSEDGQTLAWNVDAYREWRLRQRVLAGSAEVDLKTTIAGVDLDLPVLLAPTGLTGSVHWTGELGAARAAERCGTRLVMSTGSSYSIEEVGRGTNENHWFQLYPWGDRELTGSLVRRARDAGFSALFVTVDVPVLGNRLDEQRRGMGIPPVITPVRALQAGLHPRWAVGLARHRRITLRNLAEPTRGARSSRRSDGRRSTCGPT